MKKFLILDEDWICDGTILYDTPIDPVESESINDIAIMLLHGKIPGFAGFEIVRTEGVDENELIVEFFMPCTLTHQYHIIEESEATKRRYEEKCLN